MGLYKALMHRYIVLQGLYAALQGLGHKPQKKYKL